MAVAAALLLAYALLAQAEAPPSSRDHFWLACDDHTLEGSIASCALPTGPEQAMISAEYIWGLHDPNPAYFTRKSKAVDFTLMNDIHDGITLVIPPMFPYNHTSEVRKFVHDGIEMDIAAIAQALPSWKNQTHHINRFCATGGVHCLFTKKQAFDHARRELYMNKKGAGISKVLYASTTTEESLELRNLTTLLWNDWAVVCHDLYFSFQMLACHTLRNFTVFGVEVADEGSGHGDTTRYVVCHGDTSIWPRDHAAFKLLDIPYLTPNICHNENEKMVLFA